MKNHSELIVKHYEPMLGFCVCEHCRKLPCNVGEIPKPREDDAEPEKP